ncbi:MAG: hypothetical protein M5U01_06955 [Ardenticatenaceae bacterium]|nr:hypothetical protein [Ardenticatenaceae bacterium]HBY94970.1 hypothetical protein [Chloroflexota bacterium]
MLQNINRNVWFHLIERPFAAGMFETFLVHAAYALFLAQWLDPLAQETRRPILDEEYASTGFARMFLITPRSRPGTTATARPYPG